MWAVERGAEDPLLREGGVGDSVGVGPCTLRRRLVGHDEGDGSRARPIGARQLTARVAVGGGCFPIGCSGHSGEEFARAHRRTGRMEEGDAPSCMRERFSLLLFLSRLEIRLGDWRAAEGSIRTSGVAVCDSVSG